MRRKGRGFRKWVVVLFTMLLGVWFESGLCWVEMGLGEGNVM